MTCTYEQINDDLVACGGLDNLCSIYKLKWDGSPVNRAVGWSFFAGDGGRGVIGAGLTVCLFVCCFRRRDAVVLLPSSRPFRSSPRGPGRRIYFPPRFEQQEKELAAHDGYLSCCRFVGQKQLLTASGDSTCILWDVERGEPVSGVVSLSLSLSSVARVTFARGTRGLTSGFYFTQVNTYNDHAGDVMSVAVSPTDLNTFVSGSCDSSAKVSRRRLSFFAFAARTNAYSLSLPPSLCSFSTERNKTNSLSIGGNASRNDMETRCGT